MDGCIFCDPMTADGILFEDDVVMAFRNVHPRAAIHVLVVPKQHINNTSELGETHMSLVQYMVKVGKMVLAQQCQVLFTDQVLRHSHVFGFHQFPFNSVNHLHLHCIVPPYTRWWHRLWYTDSCVVGHFISADSLLEHLRLR
ncbi:hypothetical protein H257_18312 [Aphanomyces astaci]|uniref:HIT domain-containing protein n=1 Tax=Aphanomyces astaci TaxID=112090 RepID=W4FDB7_APHAT|nr:hypothetical protein H257_18312 [Aphanomyces astaci]ETV64884.1 hypothetical protein H257_18312 [Aphanomyces astaci]|eukprot:XP_009845650.1 hypothetical protein H257_18312 [Aphanomyces astaci]